MTAVFAITRRAVLAGLAPLLNSGSVNASISRDRELIRLGGMFDYITARVDASLEPSTEDQWQADALSAALDEFDVVRSRIASLRATTLLGLQVKARLVQWSSSGVASDEDTAIAIDPMALSLADDILVMKADVTEASTTSEAT